VKVGVVQARAGDSDAVDVGFADDGQGTPGAQVDVLGEISLADVACARELTCRRARLMDALGRLCRRCRLGVCELGLAAVGTQAPDLSGARPAAQRLAACGRRPSRMCAIARARPLRQ
jgi:hypothetical protein